MKTLRSVTTGLLATAMLATSVTPAIAQGYPGDYGGGHGGGRGWHHRDHDGDVGAVIAGVAVVGLIAAIAASGNRHSHDRGYDDQGYDNRDSDNRGYRGGIDSANAAADACVSSAAAQLGQNGRVTGIDEAYRTSDGFSVTGTAVIRDYGGRDSQSFRCTVRYGSISRIDFNGGRHGY